MRDVRLVLGGPVPGCFPATPAGLPGVWSSEPTVVDRERGFQFHFCGRIDNRDELHGVLGLSGRPSDGPILRELHRREGDDGWARLIGPWAIAVLDAQGRAALSRDPIGGPALFWTRLAGATVVSTDPDDLLRLPGFDPTPDDATLAAWFALRPALTEGATFHRDLRRVPQGATQRFDPEPGPIDLRRRRIAADVLYGRTDEEVEEEFRELLGRAVAARTEAGRTAVLLSSGMDSSSVAATLSEAGAEERPGAVSWTLPGHPEADEGPWIRPLVDSLDFDWEDVGGDELWPLHRPGDFQAPALGPIVSPYRSLMRAVFDRAARRGWTVLLSGADADHLYDAARDWWVDLLRERRWGVLARSSVRLAGGTPRERRVFARSVAAKLVPGSLRGRRRATAPEGLTEFARHRIVVEDEGVPSSIRQSQIERATCPWTDLGNSFERPEVERSGIELRRPYRDRRLVEFFLRLPAHQLHRPGEGKRIVRRSMRRRLPSAILAVGRRGKLETLGTRFLVTEDAAVRYILSNRRAEWDRWVDRQWMATEMERLRSSRRNSREWVVLWRCLSYELWRRPELLDEWSDSGAGRQVDRNLRRAS